MSRNRNRTPSLNGPFLRIQDQDCKSMMNHRYIASGFILAASVILLFARLGHYALWDDEAITAMTARSVWHTGDTSVRVDDHNLLVYRNGLLVRNFKDRYTSPLQFYLIAPFIGLLGDSNFICRLPMALCGVITVGILLLWLNKLRVPPLIWWSAAVILLTNASFFLFFRQCRYYGLATMLTAAVAYLYCNRPGAVKPVDIDSSAADHTAPIRALSLNDRRESLRSLGWSAGLALALSALLSAQYLDYAAVVGCLIVDYLLWGRRNPFSVRHWLIILLPQIIVGSVVLSIWNPLAQQTGNHYHSPSWVSDRIHLFWWNWRDMIGCDFVILPLLAACPLLYLKNRNPWQLCAPVALFVYIGVIALAVPTSLAQAHNAEVRYLAPALVLCIGVGIVAVAGLQLLEPPIQKLILGIAIASILIEPAPGSTSPVLGSTALLYYHELVVPQVESYTAVIDWINTHVPPGSSIYVQPGYKAYPLMFRAGKAVYAWQLSDPPRDDFRGLPDIHFYGRIAPDYMIRFGSNDESGDFPKAIDLLAARQIHYTLIDTIPLNWKDLFRPERIWRSFVTVPPGAGEEIYIYRKSPQTP